MRMTTRTRVSPHCSTPDAMLAHATRTATRACLARAITQHARHHPARAHAIPASSAPARRAYRTAIVAAAAGDIGRERAADLAKNYDDDDIEDDPLVHMGRVNKSALKRLAHEKKSLAKTLLSLPKSQVSAMVVLPSEVKEAVLQGVGIASHIAIKRHEGLVARRLRGLTDGEVAAIAGQVAEIGNGTAGAIDPRVEALATSWRENLLKGDDDARGATQSEVFGALTARDGWNFTRQELAQAVEAARKETIDRAEKISALNAAIDAEMESLARIDDAEALAETRAFIANKLKSSSAKPSVKASRKLLKFLRVIAAVVVVD